MQFFLHKTYVNARIYKLKVGEKMKQLIPIDDFGMFCDSKDTARVNSLFVAKFFGKEHKTVLRAISNILENDSGLSQEFRQHNFVPSSYRNEQNKKQPCYEMTRDGFTLLVMGFTGKKAMKFKEEYIKRFNRMEQFIKTLVNARKDYPLLTENIKLLHENPRPYHFSNECDMINRIVLGMSAKQFRTLHNIPKGSSIRPYLTDTQISWIEQLQKVDVGLLVSVPDLEQRKRYLEWYKMKIDEAIKEVS